MIGKRPVNESYFEKPLKPINSKEDIQFAKEMNKKLSEYLPL
jgi:pantothenate kinase-related protein Tda10